MIGTVKLQKSKNQKCFYPFGAKLVLLDFLLQNNNPTACAVILRARLHLEGRIEQDLNDSTYYSNPALSRGSSYPSTENGVAVRIY